MERLRQASILAIAGGVALIAGALLPWATVSTGFGSISFAGTEGDGVFVLALGIAVILAASFGFSGNRAALQVAGLLALGATVLVGYEMLNLTSRLGEQQTDFARASIGIGLWLAGAGGVIAFLAPSLIGRPPPPS